MPEKRVMGEIPKARQQPKSRGDQLWGNFSQKAILQKSFFCMDRVHDRSVYNVLKVGSALAVKILVVGKKLHFLTFQKNSTRNFKTFPNHILNFFSCIRCRIWRRFRICTYFFPTMHKNRVMGEKRKTELKIGFWPVKELFRGNFKISSGFSESTLNFGPEASLSAKSMGVVQKGPRLVDFGRFLQKAALNWTIFTSLLQSSFYVLLIIKNRVNSHRPL